jgi:hypothetical protein
MRRNRVRLKNLLRHAHHALRGGMGTGQIDAILEPGHQVLDLIMAWTNQATASRSHPHPLATGVDGRSARHDVRSPPPP